MAIRPSRSAWISLLLAAVALPATAASVEESFRQFLDGLKARGQAVMPSLGSAPEVRQPTVTMRTDGLPLGQGQSVVFVSQGCVSCAQVTKDLRRLLGSVIVMDISSSATAREAYAATGAKAVPAVLIGKRLVTGYSEAVIKRAIADDMIDQGSNTGGGA